jgi:hypothetical protein
MNIIFSNIKIRLLPILLTSLALLFGCGLGDVASRYVTTTLTPIEIATFAISDYRNCRGFPGDIDTGALPPPLFFGPGVIGVGYSGLLRPGDEHYVHLMKGAILFNLDSIPVSASNPLLVATLRFRENRTPRSGLDDRSCEPVKRVERATLEWSPETSDFTADIPSEPFPPISSCTVVSGSQYECNVSIAVQDWLANPIEHPNYGFLIRGKDVSFNTCDTNIAPPGNILECAAELTDIVLEIQYQP